MANYPKTGLELELKGLEDKFLKGLEKAEKGLDRFDKQMDQVASNSTNINAAMEKTTRSMISFRDVVGAIGLYQLTSEFTQFFSAGYQGAAAFEALALGNKQFAESIGTTTDALGAATKAAALGMIDDAEAIRQANEAIMTGAVGSQAEMEEMARIAVSLGLAMGKTAAEAIDIFTTALGKGQPRLLYQLGIMLDVDKAEQAYAASIGKTAAALTDMEKKEAVRTAALTRGREIMAGMGDISQLQQVQMQQLTTSWDEFGDSMGRMLISGEKALGVLKELKVVIDALATGADVWSGLGSEKDIIALTLGYQQAMEAMRETGAMEDIMRAFGGGVLLDEQVKALAKASTSWEEFAEVRRKVLADIGSYAGPGTGRAVQAAFGITEEQFNALQDSSKELSAELLYQASAWRTLEEAVAAEAAGHIRNIDITTYGIEVNRWWAASLAGVAGAFGNVDAASQKALDAILKKQAAVDKGWRDSGSALASYILAAQDAKAGLTGGGTGGADAEKQAADERVQNQADLNNRLAQLDQERSDKIAWVHSGDWARTAEQNAADLQFWTDHYDKLQSETILAYTGRNVEIQKKEDEAKAIAAKARAEEQAAFQARMLDLKTSAALSIMETQGTLTAFTSGMAISATDAMDKIMAGVIDLTPAMASQLAGVMAGIDSTVGTTTETQLSNLSRLKDAQDGVINDAATLAGVTSDAVDQVQVPPETVTQIDAMTVALNGAMTMFDTLATKAEGNKTIFFKSIKAMSDAVDEIEWDEEVGKPIVEGIAAGIEDNTGIGVDAVKMMAETMKAELLAAWGIKSPSTVGIYVGEQIVAGLIEGMDQAGWQVEGAAQDLIHTAMKNFLGALVGPNMRTQVLEQFDAIMADVTVGAGETYQDLFTRTIPQLVDNLGVAIGQMVQNRLPMLWAMLGETAAQTIVTATERAGGLFKAAGIFGSFGTTAAGLQRTQSTARIKALQDQLMLMDEQGVALGEQERILSEIEKERAKMVALEATQLKLQEQQAQLQFLQQQAALLDMLRTYNLNPAAILGGVQLGLGADFGAVAEAMTRAMQAILEQADAALGFQHGGAFTVPPGYPNDRYRVGLSSGERVVITPQGFAPAGSVTVTFGDVAINNGMDLAVFKSVVLQTVREASRG